MQFETWQEFFEANQYYFNKRTSLSLGTIYFTEEERYQHFKARLMDEGTPQYIIDPADWVMHTGKDKEG